MNGPLGVGVIGAGPVTHAIHLPALSTLSDRLRVVHILDVDEAIAAAVAYRTGAQVHDRPPGAARRPGRRCSGDLQPAPVPRRAGGDGGQCG